MKRIYRIIVISAGLLLASAIAAWGGHPGTASAAGKGLGFIPNSNAYMASSSGVQGQLAYANDGGANHSLAMRFEGTMNGPAASRPPCLPCPKWSNAFPGRANESWRLAANREDRSAWQRRAQLGAA